MVALYRFLPRLVAGVSTIIVAGFAVAGSANAANAPAEKQLSLVFTIKSSGEIQGDIPATLTWKKGVLTGSLDYQGAACTVSAGSTDIHSTLNLTCSVENGLSIDTYIGTLHLLTGKGKGAFTDSFFNESGTYTVAPAK